MTEEKIRILIADDSGFMRLLIRDILQSDKRMEVISTAENGKDALEKTIKFRPDVVLLDMLMPEYDGLYAVEQIMKECPTPIVILSSIGHSNINPIMKSMELGAFDYLNKPVKDNSKLRSLDAEIIRKVRLAAQSNVKIEVPKPISSNLHEHVFSNDLPYDVIVIGSSTGGPSALEAVIKKLPANLAVPVLIAQHMPVNFVPSFAMRLNKLAPLRVEVGRKNMPVEPGYIIISPGDNNMVVKKDPKTGKVIVDFSSKVYKEFNNPSVDALMNSVAETYGGRSIGAILTGMGKDGADGMTNIKRKGGYTIAQSKETCAVFGMPREAIARNCIDEVVPIDEIGGFITSCIS
ncbi:MAG: chemotaxis-specific protein-glutamate methyltransferase CheB [Cyclobacteriaceae bacterium]|nr:chemotaxis-specific protein-glutamate methyltransferase CheB [Cyclobacteriaceae bacterium]